jgi:hypothetical protein
MQVLWSRAAQAGSSCRCSSCLHAATTIARRTTTAASKRRLRFSDLFTACYSTILATAAFADARAKEDRRKEWDRVIAEARSAMPTKEPEVIQEEYPQRDSKLLDLNDIFGSHGPRASSSLLSPVWNGTTWVVPLSLESKLQTLGSQLKQQSRESVNSLSDEPETRSPEALYSEWLDNVDTELPDREPKNRLHLEKMEQHIAYLVDRFLLKAGIFSIQHLPQGSYKQQMKEMAQRIELLKKGFTQLPAYTWDDMEAVSEQRSSLHRSLTALCRKTPSDELSIRLMLAKICYNLLISTAPPNMTTYNIMLSEFTRLQRPDLAQIVIHSFFFDTRYKPRQSSVALMIKHCAAKEDRAGLKAIIQRMRGANGDMRVRKRAVIDLPDPFIQHWALTNKVIHREGCLSQKTPREPQVFDALIRASLSLLGVKSAILYVRAALREHGHVSSETLCRVIGACCAQFNFQRGVSLLRTILSLWEDGRAPEEILCSRKVRFHIHQLLSLCGVDVSPSPKESLALAIPQEALRRMLHSMRIQSLRETVGRFEELLLELKGALVAHLPEPLNVRSHDIPDITTHTNLERLDVAFSILRKSSGVEIKAAARLRRYQKANQETYRQAMLWHLDRMIVSRPQYISTIEIRMRQLRLECLKYINPEMARRISVAEPQVRQAMLQKSNFKNLLRNPEKAKDIGKAIEIGQFNALLPPTRPAPAPRPGRVRNRGLTLKSARIKRKSTKRKQHKERGRNEIAKQHNKTTQPTDSISLKLPIRLPPLSNPQTGLGYPSPDLPLLPSVAKPRVSAATG